MKKIATILTAVAMSAVIASGISAADVKVISAKADDYNASYLPEYAIDGDTEQFWHTEYEGTVNPLPISIDFELDGTYMVDSVTILPRQDDSYNGLIYVFNVYASTDGENFTLAAENVEFEYTKDPQTAEFEPFEAKYLRIEALDTEGGFVSINEFTVTGEPVAAETEAPAAEETTSAAETEAPVAETVAETEAPAETEPAPQTSDIGLAVSALALTAGAAVIFTKKKLSK